jgi:hypothetical protein
MAKKTAKKAAPKKAAKKKTTKKAAKKSSGKKAKKLGAKSAKSPEKGRIATLMEEVVHGVEGVVAGIRERVKKRRARRARK